MIIEIVRSTELDWGTKALLLTALPLIILFSLSIHEFFHALVSYALGDPTAKRMRRLTLNPLKHIDPIGTLCMFLFGFGWARPVPVDPRYYKNPKRGMALCGLAGPSINAVLGVGSFATYCVMVWLGLHPAVLNAFPLIDIVPAWLYVAVVQCFYIGGYYNILLAIFNLIPVPPLDGSRLLFAVLPDRHYFKVMRYERVIMFIMLALLWMGAFDILLDNLPFMVMSGIMKAVNGALGAFLNAFG